MPTVHSSQRPAEVSLWLVRPAPTLQLTCAPHTLMSSAALNSLSGAKHACVQWRVAAHWRAQLGLRKGRRNGYSGEVAGAISGQAAALSTM